MANTLSVNELADFCGISRKTVSEFVNNEGLESEKVGREVRIKFSDALRFLWERGQKTESGDIAQLRARKLEEEIRKLENLNQRLSGETLGVREATFAWQTIQATLQKRLDAAVRPYGNEAIIAVNAAVEEAKRDGLALLEGE